jgi:thiamine transport system substrate-binding protein
MKRTLILLFVALFFGCFQTPKDESKKSLTIYTYDAFASKWGPAPKIKALFEKEHNCTLHFVGVSSSIGALRKIELEGVKTKADILLGLDSSTIGLAKKSALFDKFEYKTSELSLPISFHDESFVPFDFSYFAFVYDAKKLKNPPHSFEELANMPKNFKIAIQDPRTSTSGYGLLLWVKSIYKEKAKEYWKRLKPHILTVTKGWSESYNLFLKGEADMALSYTTSPAYHMIAEHKDSIKAAKFQEGHYLQIEVAALLKSSKNRTLAREFLEFLTSKEFASIIPTTNWAYPVRRVKLPKEFEHLIEVKNALFFDQNYTNSHHKEIIDEWLEAISE